MYHACDKVYHCTGGHSESTSTSVACIDYLSSLFLVKSYIYCLLINYLRITISFLQLSLCLQEGCFV